MATENNNLSVYDKTIIPNAKNFRFGIIVSEWNPKITEGMFQGAFDAIIDCEVLKKISFDGMCQEVLNWFMVVRKCKKAMKCLMLLLQLEVL